MRNAMLLAVVLAGCGPVEVDEVGAVVFDCRTSWACPDGDGGTSDVWVHAGSFCATLEREATTQAVALSGDKCASRDGLCTSCFTTCAPSADRCAP